MFKKLLFLCLFSILLSEDFSDGPYGTGYFDTAGPFQLPDLNMQLNGDVNLDENVNIQDVILIVGEVLDNYSLNDEQFNQADTNNDNIIDILDIVEIVNLILNPQDPLWDFEQNWTGQDSYIFIQYDPTVSSSTALWSSNTKEEFLNISPSNVHYFFISNRAQYESDIDFMKSAFDDILLTLPENEQIHWNSHLHFVNAKTSDLNNWLSESLSGTYGISIDCFQRIREIGYLGNPASFSGTYLSYVAHEAIYFNYELETLYEPDRSYEEITVFDKDLYSGWWGSTISEIVTFPSNEELSSFSGMSVELLRGCPDCGLFDGGATEIECGDDINYSDAGCDDYDRKALMYLCDINGENCLEIARWITPFGRQPHHLTDITPFISAIRPGGEKMIKFQETGWPNSLLTLKFRFYNDNNNQLVPQEIIPVWNGTVQFNPSYNDNRPPQVFSIPENAEKVEFVAYITGHGWGSAGCFNCCEFCNSRHVFELNGGVYEFDKDYPNASSSNYCMQPSTIEQGVIPNQGGTWGYGRAGWCPGMDVHPYITDITDYVEIGQDNVIDYSACRVVGNNCVTAPTCNGDGYCPEVAFSSYIIISY